MNIENLVRENIKKLKPYSSARDSFLEGTLLDANENGIGSVWDEYAVLNRYPDPNHRKLRQAASAYLGVNADQLFFGVGSDEVIDLLIRIFCKPETDSIMITDPSYGMYEVAADVNDVKVIKTVLDENFQLDLNDIREKVEAETKIVFLCSPNNPTGNLLKKEDILELVNDLNCLVVIDEAYMDFAESNSLKKEVRNFENLIVLRTYSKAWGMAGIRCGFSVASPYITELLYKVKAPYNLNMMTQKGILKAIENKSTKDSFVSTIISEREKVYSELAKMSGVKKVYPSEANFLIFEVENPDEVYQTLVKKEVIIRNRSRMTRLSGCLRVSIGNSEENELFINELRRIL
ncbi:MAG: histidinol-phosphate transaminase [Bacteroidetes bacterium]|nr:histidinol-phosphate transaminase [Bacteroidota bacterium]